MVFARLRRMMLNVALRLRLLTAGAIVAALWLAWQLASGEYAWPAIAAAVALGAGVVALFRVPSMRL